MAIDKKLDNKKIPIFLWQRINDLMFSFPDQINNDCRKEYLKELVGIVAEMEKFVKDCRDSWDCDNDAHKYGTTCRSCEAKKILSLIRQENENE